MRRIGLVVVPQFQVMSLLALSVFDIANLRAGRKLYEVSVISEDGGPVEASFGMIASTKPALVSELHTVFVGAVGVVAGLLLALGVFSVLQRIAARRRGM